jgi:hypothetical protein
MAKLKVEYALNALVEPIQPMEPVLNGLVEPMEPGVNGLVEPIEPVLNG